jgi:hypothetical protein
MSMYQREKIQFTVSVTKYKLKIIMFLKDSEMKTIYQNAEYSNGMHNVARM